MSLTARLANLIAGDSSPPAAQPPDSDFVSQHDGFADAGADFGITRKNKRVRTMEAAAENEGLEMKRPPYLQVCPESPSFALI
jgi:hypothetical protein